MKHNAIRLQRRHYTNGIDHGSGSGMGCVTVASAEDAAPGVVPVVKIEMLRGSPSFAAHSVDLISGSRSLCSVTGPLRCCSSFRKHEQLALTYKLLMKWQLLPSYRTKAVDDFVRTLSGLLGRDARAALGDRLIADMYQSRNPQRDSTFV
jgi:hypothetical protein